RGLAQSSAQSVTSYLQPARRGHRIFQRFLQPIQKQLRPAHGGVLFDEFQHVGGVVRLPLELFFKGGSNLRDVVRIDQPSARKQIGGTGKLAQDQAASEFAARGNVFEGDEVHPIPHWCYQG